MGRSKSKPRRYYSWCWKKNSEAGEVWRSGACGTDESSVLGGRWQTKPLGISTIGLLTLTGNERSSKLGCCVVDRTSSSQDVGWTTFDRGRSQQAFGDDDVSALRVFRPLPAGKTFAHILRCFLTTEPDYRAYWPNNWHRFSKISSYSKCKRVRQTDGKAISLASPCKW